jgi:tetratricopeptide (TPR) repeat protein
VSDVNAPDRRALREPRSKTLRRAGQTPRVLGPILLALTVLQAPAAAAKCRIGRLPDIAVTMDGLVPLLHAQLNGRDALFIADSGAFFSFVFPPAVREFHLVLNPSIQGLYVEGTGGLERAQVARARTFALAGLNKTWEHVDFVVAGATFAGTGPGAVGLLGQNLFRLADVEYDLANGIIRLVQPADCGKDTPLAYWAGDAHKPYSVIDIDFATLQQPHTRSVAYLNGARIRVLFDTGAATSVLTLDAAKRAGVTPGSEGVIAAGRPAVGIGRRVSQTWIGRFASFKLGDEEILHAELRFGDILLPGADMLIGADFFLSHRIYVASSQHKLYFTYNGGPVFNLTQASAPATESADGGTVPRSPPAENPAAAPAAAGAAQADVNARLDEPSDAAGFARRGAASAARHDYAGAIADLTRACELAPSVADYFYQRGTAYWYSRQADAALADFDQAIKLKADASEALLARASLRAERHDPPEVVIADLEAADRSLSKESNLHQQIGRLYESVGQPAAAVVQYSQWIDSHPHDDPRMAATLNARCWARALTGQALDQALADCNAALKIHPNTATFLGSRALVYLRQSNYDKAIGDYDAALLLRPKTAWSLYGRGLAKLRKGMKSEGQADLNAASALDPKIAEQAGRYGIT